MNILITGGAGYIGSTMTRLFLEHGHNVRVLDRFYFGKEPISDIKFKNFDFVQGDIRTIDSKIFQDIDTVIDLAAISNDPAGELNPTTTWDINFLGRARIAFLAKKFGVKRYIQASSCSIYGQQGEIADENSPIKPLTTYAKAHREQEKFALNLNDKDFTVTVLRQATVYGLSHRMRFDLAINGMVGAIFESGKQSVMRDGTQWRPFVHVRDTSKAFLLISETESEIVNGQIYNVGSNDQNYQIADLAKLVRDSINTDLEWDWYGDPDHRSYKVSFDKIKNQIDFQPELTPKIATENIFNALKTGSVQKTDKTITVKWYKKLLDVDNTYESLRIDQSIL